MKVSDLMAELAQMPPDVSVKIECIVTCDDIDGNACYVDLEEGLPLCRDVDSVREIVDETGAIEVKIYG